MSSNTGGRLVVISGPSGAGKSTLWKRLIMHPGITFSVSATTRKPRPGEKHGSDYVFLDDAQFDEHVSAGDFLEYAEVHGNRYGTLRSEVERAMDDGNDVLLEIDVQGADQLQGCDLPMVSIFVMPPSVDALEERLRGRESETEEQLRVRLQIAETEMQHSASYDHVVVNDDLERMISEVEELLGLAQRS